LSALEPELLLAGLFASVRVVALAIVAPVFGNTAVPMRMRAGLGILVASSLSQGLAATALPELSSGISLAGAVVGELLIGFALGFSARLVFDAMGLVGGLLSAQGGLGAATLIDPGSGASTTSPSLLLESIAVLLYFAIDGHHVLIRALATSFSVLPPGGGGPFVASAIGIAGLGADLFSIAVRLAAPVTAALLLANLAMGVLGRVLPEMNLMMVQIPAHVLLMLGMMLAGVSGFTAAVAGALESWPGRAFTAVMGAP